MQPRLPEYMENEKTFAGNWLEMQLCIVVVFSTRTRSGINRDEFFALEQEKT
jgi:hypothetical protein